MRVSCGVVVVVVHRDAFLFVFAAPPGTELVIAMTLKHGKIGLNKDFFYGLILM